jgi:superoxide dismutase, Cu-Zn family
MNAKLMGLLAVSALGLMACNTPTMMVKTVNFAARTQTGYTAQAGEAKIEKLSSGGIKTTLTLTGLKANTAYVAHYHAKGTASAVACDSAGGISTDYGAAVTSNASGQVTLTTTKNTANVIADLGAYINVHEESALSVVPLCADVSSTTF